MASMQKEANWIIRPSTTMMSSHFEVITGVKDSMIHPSNVAMATVDDILKITCHHLIPSAQNYHPLLLPGASASPEYEEFGLY